MSHITIEHGDLLRAPVEALVNTVNCVGVMGKGIALQFERTFPEIVPRYKAACAARELRPGHLLVVPLQPTLERQLPLAVVNFATKDHWRAPSRLEWIEAGLKRLVAEVDRQGWRSIAIPPLGCGNGGLKWEQVRPLVEEAFAARPHVKVLLFPPGGAPDARTMWRAAKPPTMTTRAALKIRLLARYSVVDLEFSQLELQKLAYFLQTAGEPLHLTFEAKKYGPAAPELFRMLRRWKGHWTMGFGDGTRGLRDPVMLRPEIVDAAEAYLAAHPAPASEHRVERVLELIEGMNTAAGLELLATVHWVARRDSLAAVDLQLTVDAVHAWNDHKRRDFPREWIHAAWQRLNEKGWMRDLEPIPQIRVDDD